MAISLGVAVSLPPQVPHVGVGRRQPAFFDLSFSAQNFFTRHPWAMLRKNETFFIFFAPFLSCENPAFLHPPGPPLGGVISPFPGPRGFFWAEMCTVFYILIHGFA